MKYIAADGTTFETESACINYESTLATRLIGDIPHKIVNAEDLFDGNYSNLYVFMRIESKEQLANFKTWISMLDGGKDIKDEDSFLGKEIIVDCYNYEDDGLDGIEGVYSVETVEENVARYANKIYKIANSI